jgi:hypothetical protein
VKNFLVVSTPTGYCDVPKFNLDGRARVFLFALHMPANVAKIDKITFNHRELLHLYVALNPAPDISDDDGTLLLFPPW